MLSYYLGILFLSFGIVLEGYPVKQCTEQQLQGSNEFITTPPVPVLSDDSSTLANNQCGGLFVLTPNETVSFGSASHPGQYPQDEVCHYVVQVTEGFVVELIFTKFEVEYTTKCTDDYVTIQDGDFQNGSFIGRHCGSFLQGKGSPPPTVIRTTGVLASLTFVSDSSDSYTGVYVYANAVEENSRMLQSTVSVCNDVRHILTDRGGILVSHPGYDNGTSYPNVNEICVMRIQGLLPRDLIHLDFIEMDLRGSNTGSYCNPAKDDTILITDPANGLQLGEILCSDKTAFYQSASGAIDISFNTHYHQDNGNHSGFKAVYTIYYNDSECDDGDFLCGTDDWCIAPWLVCNGYFHCISKYDEAVCDDDSQYSSILGEMLFVIIMVLTVVYLVVIVIHKACKQRCRRDTDISLTNVQQINDNTEPLPFTYSNSAMSETDDVLSLETNISHPLEVISQDNDGSGQQRVPSYQSVNSQANGSSSMASSITEIDLPEYSDLFHTDISHTASENEDGVEFPPPSYDECIPSVYNTIINESSADTRF